MVGYISFDDGYYHPDGDRHDAMTWEDGDYTAEQAEADDFAAWHEQQGAAQWMAEHPYDPTPARYASDDDNPF